MRNLILSLFIFLGFVANAQQTLDADVSTEFVHSKINELNLKIWNAVHSGEIAAYRNDSLATQLTPVEIHKQTSLETVVMIPNPDNPTDPYDLVEKRTIYYFDSSSEFKGVNLHYAKVLKGKSVSFELVSIAPTCRPMTESGINLGIQPLFNIKIKDVKKLKNIDYSFYEALFTLRASLGDFIKPHYAPFEDAEQLGQEISYYNLWHSQHYMHFSDFQDSIVGNHLAYLPIAIAIDRQNRNLPFFRDLENSDPYIDVQSELQDSSIVMVPNPDNPDDPYDLIAVQVYEFFDLDNIKDVSIVRTQKDFTFNLKKRCLLSGSYMSADQCSRDIYYSLKQSKKLLRPHDRIVLESLLQEITK